VAAAASGEGSLGVAFVVRVDPQLALADLGHESVAEQALDILIDDLHAVSSPGRRRRVARLLPP